MTTFALMRHAETDYTFPNEVKTRGWGFDLAPLAANGKAQVLQKSSEIIQFQPELVLVSPTTRTMHTAMYIRPLIDAGIDFIVEPYLHEWLPDNTFTWDSYATVLEILGELEKNKGEWPQGETRNWESLSMLRERVLKVFDKYLTYKKILVVCHGGVIWSITGVKDVENCEIKVFEYNGPAGDDGNS